MSTLGFTWLFGLLDHKTALKKKRKSFCNWAKKGRMFSRHFFISMRRKNAEFTLPNAPQKFSYPVSQLVNQSRTETFPPTSHIDV